MTEPELRRWFGLPDDDERQIFPAIIDGMKDVPVPAADVDHLAAYRVFLALKRPA
jgi:hypothetical protein